MVLVPSFLSLQFKFDLINWAIIKGKSLFWLLGLHLTKKFPKISTKNWLNERITPILSPKKKKKSFFFWVVIEINILLKNLIRSHMHINEIHWNLSTLELNISGISFDFTSALFSLLILCTCPFRRKFASLDQTGLAARFNPRRFPKHRRIFNIVDYSLGKNWTWMEVISILVLINYFFSCWSFKCEGDHNDSVQLQGVSLGGHDLEIMMLLYISPINTLQTKPHFSSITSLLIIETKKDGVV